MAKINLLKNYPKTRRNLDSRIATKTKKHHHIARKFGQDFFDGSREFGYGGYYYQKRFWHPVVPTFQKYYNLTHENSILDIGCAKGFMLYDFKTLIPGIQVAGLDISTYALTHAQEAIKPFIKVGNAKKLPYENASFDLVISINTVHNLNLDDCKKAISEIQRVSKKHSFITVDAYKNEEEKKRMLMWNLTALTILHVDEWESLFKEIGYTGDYYWFTP